MTPDRVSYRRQINLTSRSHIRTTRSIPFTECPWITAYRLVLPTVVDEFAMAVVPAVAIIFAVMGVPGARPPAGTGLPKGPAAPAESHGTGGTGVGGTRKSFESLKLSSDQLR